MAKYLIGNISAGSGQEAFSPIAKVTPVSGGAKISITDKNGTTTATVLNGSSNPYIAGNGISISNNTISLNATIPNKVSQLINDANYATTAHMANKQDKLTAGANITIDQNNVISATAGEGTVEYTAGDGINISGTTLSVDTDTIASKDYVNNVFNNVSYIAGDNIIIEGNTISAEAIENAYTAGDGIEIIDNVITNTITDVGQLANTRGYIVEETDPVFSVSPAASITAEDIQNWNSGSGGGSDLPEIETGDAGKVLAVNSEEDGVEWIAASSGGGGIKTFSWQSNYWPSDAEFNGYVDWQVLDEFPQTLQDWFTTGAYKTETDTVKLNIKRADTIYTYLTYIGYYNYYDAFDVIQFSGISGQQPAFGGYTSIFSIRATSSSISSGYLTQYQNSPLTAGTGISIQKDQAGITISATGGSSSSGLEADEKLVKTTNDTISEVLGATITNEVSTWTQGTVEGSDTAIISRADAQSEWTISQFSETQIWGDLTKSLKLVFTAVSNGDEIGTADFIIDEITETTNNNQVTLTDENDNIIANISFDAVYDSAWAWYLVNNFAVDVTDTNIDYSNNISITVSCYEGELAEVKNPINADYIPNSIARVSDIPVYTAGTGINITNNVISATGGGSGGSGVFEPAIHLNTWWTAQDWEPVAAQIKAYIDDNYNRDLLPKVVTSQEYVFTIDNYPTAEGYGDQRVIFSSTEADLDTANGATGHTDKFHVRYSWVVFNIDTSTGAISNFKRPYWSGKPLAPGQLGNGFTPYTAGAENLTYYAVEGSNQNYPANALYLSGPNGSVYEVTIDSNGSLTASQISNS